MFFIQRKHGNDGYSTWFRILEELGKANHHFIDLRDETNILYLSSQLYLSEEKAVQIIDDLAKIHAIDPYLWNENRVIYSKKFCESIADAYNKRTNKLLPYEGLLRVLGVSGTGNPVNSVNNPHTKVKYSKVKKSIYTRAFDRFWETYPRRRGKKVGKKKAFDQFQKIPEDELERVIRNARN
ncbi:MAG: DUF4373 domain-containing protein, partial [Candidatus Aminicenantes bacterium]|nr:DUF4373 domain-containing protein [Candidatus Aminicenantes bacterium]NIQ73635.1 DUF4373 domain-containing protein [Candidatus Aminicenantes bacterium]NIT29736.1 DUF4373 domain-containing protein [Candidatus Aminicenantes bacterium]